MTSSKYHFRTQFKGYKLNMIQIHDTKLSHQQQIRSKSTERCFKKSTNKNVCSILCNCTVVYRKYNILKAFGTVSLLFDLTIDIGCFLFHRRLLLTITRLPADLDLPTAPLKLKELRLIWHISYLYMIAQYFLF